MTRIVENLTRAVDWGYKKIFSKKARESFFGCIPIAIFVLGYSAVLLIYCLYEVLRLKRLDVLLLPFIWALYGIMPASNCLGFSHQTNVQFALWAVILGGIQSLIWYFRLLVKANTFRLMPPERRQAIFDGIMQSIFGERWQFKIGLVWDDIGGWILLFVLLVMTAFLLWYICEMYRSFYLHVLDGSRGWEVGPPRLPVHTGDTADAQWQQQQQQQQQQPLLPPAGPIEQGESSKDTQRQLFAYYQKLQDYYCQYGELGERASATGLPIEAYLQTLPVDQRRKWEAYKRDLEASRGDGDETSSESGDVLEFVPDRRSSGEEEKVGAEVL